jgi:putative transposase
MPYDPDRHHRRSIRLAGYDYRQSGSYFVTICTHERAALFGTVAAGQVALSPYGVIVSQQWHRIAEQLAYVTLDSFVVMPDHIHGLLALACSAGAPPPETVAPRGTAAGSLSAVMQNFKSVTARRINRLRGTPGVPVWQRNYYERIVRSEEELYAVRRYIAANPAAWEKRRGAR